MHASHPFRPRRRAYQRLGTVVRPGVPSRRIQRTSTQSDHREPIQDERHRLGNLRRRTAAIHWRYAAPLRVSLFRGEKNRRIEQCLSASKRVRRTVHFTPRLRIAEGYSARHGRYLLLRSLSIMDSFWILHAIACCTRLAGMRFVTS